MIDTPITTIVEFESASPSTIQSEQKRALDWRT